MRDLKEKTLHSTPIYNGKIITVQLDDVVLPNGKQGKREIVKHPGAVAIIPFTADGKIVLVRQFRKPLEKVIYEIPAGKLDVDEEPYLCALRELKEETGYTPQDLQLLTSFYTSPGFADEKIYLFEANNLEQGVANPDQDEFVDVIEVSLEEALEMVRNEQIHDAKTAYAIQHWQIRKLRNG